MTKITESLGGTERLNFEAKIIMFLQKGSNPFTDGLMLFLTQLGDEWFFLIVVLAVYLCVNKRTGFKILNVYLIGAAVTNVFKSIVKRPRPFVKYEGKIISIGRQSDGWSFPSGHSNSIANISTQGFCNFYRRWKIVLPLGIAVTLIVMLSRMFLGQHYLTDVLCGAAMGIVTAVPLGMLFELIGDKEEYLFIAEVPLCVIAAVILFIKDGSQADTTIFRALGALSAFGTGYFIEKKYIGFCAADRNPVHTLIKLTIGLCGALLLGEGLRRLLPFFDGLNYLIAYFLLGFWITVGAPLLYKKFGWGRRTADGVQVAAEDLPQPNQKT